MDLYNFYNGMNNIVNLSMNNKDYIVNSEKIHNDPLVLLDFQTSFNLKGGVVPGAAKTDAVAALSKSGVVPAAGADAAPDADAKKASITATDLATDLATVFRKLNKKITPIQQAVTSQEAARKRDEIEQKKLLESQIAALDKQTKNDLKAETAEQKRKKKERREELKAKKKAAEEAEKEAEEEAKKEEEEEAQEEIERELQKLEEEEQKREQKESLSTRGVNALKLLIKLVVFLAFITLLPIAPFIAISYYSFKKLKEYYDNQIVTL